MSAEQDYNQMPTSIAEEPEATLATEPEMPVEQEEASPQPESTPEPEAPESTPEQSESVEQESVEQTESAAPEEESEAPVDFDDLFPEEDKESVAEDDEPAEKPAQAPAGSAEQPEWKKAREAQQAARAKAQDVDGSKTTQIVEAENALVPEEKVELDDLDWLNEEDQDFTFEDLFPEVETEFALEDGKGPTLELTDEGHQQATEVVPEERKNAFEAGLDRLKKKRVNTELTSEQAETLMEDLICKMTHAADEDARTIRRNMAKERLAKMCQKQEQASRHRDKKQRAFLEKKDNYERFQKLYKFAEFPDGKEQLKSFFGEDKTFNPAAAVRGTRKLLEQHDAEPAMDKVVILKECISQIMQPDKMNWFVTFGGLTVLRTWLSPNPDGTLPALTLRTELLRCLQKLPISADNLKKSKLGTEIRALMKRSDENLANRKVCQELISKWLAQVLDVQSSIRTARIREQEEMKDVAQPVKKKRKTAAQIEAEQKEIQERRHPQMFQKASHNFKVQPEFEVHSMAGAEAAKRQTRKGKIGKCAGELRALRPASRHDHVSIAGGGINLNFGNK